VLGTRNRHRWGARRSPIFHSRVASVLPTSVEASKAKSVGARIRTFAKIRPRDLIPVHPRSPSRLPANRWASRPKKWPKRITFSREAQDRWRFAAIRLPPGTADAGSRPRSSWYRRSLVEGGRKAGQRIRTDTSLEQMARLKPVFDRRYGTVTAANASPDGWRVAVLLMKRRGRARAGYEGASPSFDHMRSRPLIQGAAVAGAALGGPQGAGRAGYNGRTSGLIEMHEAFASQVLSNLQGFARRGGRSTRTSST